MIKLIHPNGVNTIVVSSEQQLKRYQKNGYRVYDPQPPVDVVEFRKNQLEEIMKVVEQKPVTPEPVEFVKTEPVKTEPVKPEVKADPIKKPVRKPAAKKRKPVKK